MKIKKPTELPQPLSPLRFRSHLAHYASATLLSHPFSLFYTAPPPPPSSSPPRGSRGRASSYSDLHLSLLFPARLVIGIRFILGESYLLGEDETRLSLCLQRELKDDEETQVPRAEAPQEGQFLRVQGGGWPPRGTKHPALPPRREGRLQKVGSCPPPSLACLLSGLVLIQFPDNILLIFYQIV
jgi:hypothetical protein